MYSAVSDQWPSAGTWKYVRSLWASSSRIFSVSMWRAPSLLASSCSAMDCSRSFCLTTFLSRLFWALVTFGPSSNTRLFSISDAILSVSHEACHSQCKSRLWVNWNYWKELSMLLELNSWERCNTNNYLQLCQFNGVLISHLCLQLGDFVIHFLLLLRVAFCGRFLECLNFGCYNKSRREKKQNNGNKTTSSNNYLRTQN